MFKVKPIKYDAYSQQDVKVCLDKKVYASKNAARDAIAKIGYDLHPYKCLVCRRWHATAVPKEYGSSVKDVIRKRKIK